MESHPSFPDDDMNALQQMASNSRNLDYYYAHQYVQNENVKTTGMDTK